MDKVVADDWVFARTNSAGTTTINATGDQVADGNQELFVLKKTDRRQLEDRALSLLHHYRRGIPLVLHTH